MESPLFFSQLVLFALLWLFIILHLLQPKRPVTVPESPAAPEPMTPKRRRSNEPKPFEDSAGEPLARGDQRDKRGDVGFRGLRVGEPGHNTFQIDPNRTEDVLEMGFRQANVA
jgi:hypothetical protein